METRRDNLQFQYLCVITFAKQIEICASIELMAQYIISDKMPWTVQEPENYQSFLISSNFFWFTVLLLADRQAGKLGELRWVASFTVG